MKLARETLPQNLWKGIERSLGREEALRLLWPALVGAHLAGLTELHTLRGATLVVAVADREWKAPLQTMEQMILEAVNRFARPWQARSIEFMVKARQTALPAMALPRRCGGALSMNSPSVAAPGIEDQRLREAFVLSAQKYFAQQQGRIE